MTRTIAIKTVLNGFVVKVGCQTVVFTSRADLINHLDQYLKAENPYQFEETFLAGAINANKLGYTSDGTGQQNAAVSASTPRPSTLDDAFDFNITNNNHNPNH